LLFQFCTFFVFSNCLAEISEKFRALKPNVRNTRSNILFQKFSRKLFICWGHERCFIQGKFCFSFKRLSLMFCSNSEIFSKILIIHLEIFVRTRFEILKKACRRDSNPTSVPYMNINILLYLLGCY
jgi:hypothetical protein